MGFFDRLLGRAEVEAQSVSSTGEVTSTVVTPQRALVNKAALQSVGLRPGMWVNAVGKVGLVTACDKDGVVEIVFQNPDGTTKMTIDETGQKLVSDRIYLPPSEATQANIEDIPESRRGDPDALRSMGYKNRSAA